MPKALVHTVSPKINDCELTHLDRKPIDIDLAEQQHAAYCQLLESHGFEVVKLCDARHHPDAVFIEDTAVVFDEFAVLTNPGAASRRGEISATEAELKKYRKSKRIETPATLDGGDVVHIGNTVFVGETRRTNQEGIKAFAKMLKRYDYEVIPVNVRDCLHLKSACTAITNRSLLANPDWVNLDPFSHMNVITVDETWAANTIRLSDTIYLAASFPKTINQLRELGFRVDSIDVSEFLKAEGGLSCLSIRF
ncbi:MAG: dimethylarginine dimethylaminohydrolase family protein [bacterium]